jgi:hypothetical protein
VRIEMCLLISTFLGYEYIIPINLRLNLQAKDNICLFVHTLHLIYSTHNGDDAPKKRKKNG